MPKTVLLLGTIAANPGLSQTLSLFEPLEGAAAVGSRQQVEQPVPAVAGPVPAFSLRSSSRFGDIYRSVVVDDADNTLEVDWKPGDQSSLPRYAGYVVIGASARTLTLRYPPAVSCTAPQAPGFECVDANTALLSLRSMAPLESNGNASGPVGSQPDPGSMQAAWTDEASGNPQFINPFAAAMAESEGTTEIQVLERAERARARAERLQQFQLERIPEDQVPPGMRLVRTPFGDRLVPIRE